MKVQSSIVLVTGASCVGSRNRRRHRDVLFSRAKKGGTARFESLRRGLGTVRAEGDAACDPCSRDVIRRRPWRKL